jgi:hypothetical protein
MTYEPWVATQLDDGGHCPSRDCVACCGATLARIASVGRWAPTAPEIREASGTSCWTGTGGLEYGRMATAVELVTKGEVVIDVFFHQSHAQLRDYIVGGSGVVESITYSELHGTRYASDEDYMGGHGVVLNGLKVSTIAYYRMGDPLADGRRPGIPDGWQWVPSSIIYDAGDRRSVQAGGYGLTLAVANDTKNVNRTARLATTVRAQPNFTSKVVGSTVEGHNYYALGTTNGASWQRDTNGNRGRATGWWHIELPSGARGYVPGKVLVPTWAR